MTPTFDLVRAAHKATRHFMFDTLVRLGALDLTDADDIAATVEQIERLLAALGEPRADWRSGLHALRHGTPAERHAAAASLYRHLSGLVANRLPRLQRVEADTPAVPMADAGARFAALDDAELASALGWMQAALAPPELAALLDTLHATASAPRFHAALALLSERMDERRWNQLARALGIAPAGVPLRADVALAA